MSVNNLINFAKRFLLTLSFVVLVSVTACAYTVVTRGGKRIEIPEQFAVTRTTVTYEGAPGINVTLQMARLDRLVGDRAALQTRFRMLEDEARRAGVPPGWLRP